MSSSNHPTHPTPTAATTTDPSLPLSNLAALRHRVDSLSRYLSDSVNANTILPQNQIDSISSDLFSAINQVIINGAALLASQTQTQPRPNPVLPKPEPQTIDLDIVEMEAMELLAEDLHICEICGKGFKRDANLRMHMRAHGDQYKTNQALNRPEATVLSSIDVDREVRFSCPYVGCSRNKAHEGFRPLKSMICVKNHFRRTHCLKLYSCTRCNKKSFSVVGDLKNHMRHCGVISKWKCSCGTSFSRKEKLFAHMSLFEGHMPAVDVSTAAVAVKEGSSSGSGSVFDEFWEGFGSVDHLCFEDMIVDSNPNG